MKFHITVVTCKNKVLDTLLKIFSWIFETSKPYYFYNMMVITNKQVILI